MKEQIQTKNGSQSYETPRQRGSVPISLEFWVQILVVVIIIGGLAFLTQKVFQLEGRVSKA